MSTKPHHSESWKHFLLSLLATTVSIALTFGTAAVIYYNKEQNEKREIVMMVMYDMYNSMMSIEKNDSMIRQSMEVQRQMAEEPTRFDELRFQMAQLMPQAGYTETTEHIFRRASKPSTLWATCFSSKVWPSSIRCDSYTKRRSASQCTTK